jgi:hypothetical protein
MTGHVWTPGMLIAFRDLYRQRPELPLGVIATKMSELFGIEITKNACVGKAHRLDLPQRGHRTGPRKPHHPKRERKIRMVRIDAPIEPEPEPPAEAVEPGISIYQLTGTTCRWPLGSTMSRPPLRYCGCWCEIELPYCYGHTLASRGHSHGPRKVAVY